MNEKRSTAGKAADKAAVGALVAITAGWVAAGVAAHVVLKAWRRRHPVPHEDLSQWPDTEGDGQS